MSVNHTQHYKQSVFIDETALTAFMNPNDPHYLKARTLFLDLDDLERDFITTNSIVFEVHRWLRNGFDYALADFFLNVVEKAASRGKLLIIPGGPEWEQEARQLLIDRPELQYSLNEALTAVVMSAYGIKRIFTFNPNHSALKNMDKEMKIIPSGW
ncbi:type II toxin-antitoxin system VapC family toxin [Paenibacillus thalictri]|uniref:PIN domain-containing protein n=1 Tax=Paenibacillus thalictri TaxID=2527873 RepID=A0A4Q9DES4_9BACL|nr:type II toxin-antitoxin system VapC family toxin [Paenibacillus thalictri]TBL70262.1 hypothetical protein EYB31_33630 [Paenibacillus thalictri]